MSLSKIQREFTECIGKLIQYAYDQEYELTLGDAYRDPRVHGEFGEKVSYSSGNSVHKIRLAFDLNLWVDNQYITDGNCIEFRDLGGYWKSLHPLSRWGGDFKTNDGNHFSFEYWGCK